MATDRGEQDTECSLGSTDAERKGKDDLFSKHVINEDPSGERNDCCLDRHSATSSSL